MAGTKIKDTFKELISPFLKAKMEEAKKDLVKIVQNILRLQDNISIMMKKKK